MDVIDCLGSRLLHVPDSKITSGVYTITNVATGYRAVLRGADLASLCLTVSNELGAAKEVSSAFLYLRRVLIFLSVEYSASGRRKLHNAKWTTPTLCGL